MPPATAPIDSKPLGNPLIKLLRASLSSLSVIGRVVTMSRNSLMNSTTDSLVLGVCTWAVATNGPVPRRVEKLANAPYV